MFTLFLIIGGIGFMGVSKLYTKGVLDRVIENTGVSHTDMLLLSIPVTVILITLFGWVLTGSTTAFVTFLFGSLGVAVGIADTS